MIVLHSEIIVLHTPAFTDGMIAQHFIMVHCGGVNWFVPNTRVQIRKQIWKFNDYHDDVSHKNYMKWVEEKLLPNLEKISVLVIDNASYHNVP